MRLVRARDEQDMVRMLTRLGVDPTSAVHTPDHDYPWRVVMHKSSWSEYLLAANAAIDYTNFKERVAATLGHERANLYLDVWLTMMELQRG